MGSMDKKPLRPNHKPGKPTNRGVKNTVFVALIVLLGLVVFAASNQQTTLKQISSTQAINDTNAGKYSSIVVAGNELDITPKGAKQATLKTYVDGNASLKDQGF